MLITSRQIGLGILGLFLLSGSAWAAAIQGDVRGPDGKAVAGADVRIDRKDKKAAPMAVKTDHQGQYSFTKLDVGTYKLQASSNGMAATASNDIKTRSDGTVRVDFSLKTAKAAATKKKMHKVWVHADTGSNIGGKWVDVPDDEAAPVTTSTEPGVNNLSKGGNTMVRGAQQASGGNRTGGN
jgi:uncharacterized surface anchored protein